MSDAYLIGLTRRFVGGMVPFDRFTEMVHDLWAGRQESDAMQCCLLACWSIEAEAKMDDVDSAESLAYWKDQLRHEFGSERITSTIPVWTGHETQGNPCAVVTLGAAL
jgi:hypothetical protein